MRKIEQVMIRKDFERLLAIIADKREPDFSEVEAIAERNGFAFANDGKVIAAKGSVVKAIG